MISVSAISYLGMCQIAFLFNKKAKIVTRAMIEGARRHNKLFLVTEALTQEEMIEKITKGEKFVSREISVTDHQNGLRGRVDEIEFLGPNENGKNMVLIKDDKFSSTKFSVMSNVHKIQLASYALVMPNDPKFKGIVEVVGASINLRSLDSEQFDELKMPVDELNSWGRKIPDLLEFADNVYKNNITPKPCAFSIAEGWASIPLGTCKSCKYNRICIAGRNILKNQGRVLPGS